MDQLLLLTRRDFSMMRALLDGQGAIRSLSRSLLIQRAALDGPGACSKCCLFSRHPLLLVGFASPLEEDEPCMLVTFE